MKTAWDVTTSLLIDEILKKAFEGDSGCRVALDDLKKAKADKWYKPVDAGSKNILDVHGLLDNDGHIEPLVCEFLNKYPTILFKVG